MKHFAIKSACVVLLISTAGAGIALAAKAPPVPATGSGTGAGNTPAPAPAPGSGAPAGSGTAPGVAPGAPGAPSQPAGGDPSGPASSKHHPGAAKTGSGGSGHNDMPVSITAPAVVAEAAARYFGDATKEIHKELQEGITWWTATGTKDGMHVALRMTETGEIVQTQTMMRSDEVPGAIRSQLKKLIPGATLEKAVEVQSSYYEITFTSEGRTRRVKVYANGQLVPSGTGSDTREASANAEH